jgi:conjugal transfer mating pair stabilization protein TraN
MILARLLLATAAFVVGGLTFVPTSASAQQLCAVDLNGNGDAADEGETANCHLTAAGGWMCPIGETACVTGSTGAPECPLGPQFGCAVPAAGGVPTCSPNSCIDTRSNPIVEEPVPDDPGALPDGPVDAEGNCLGTIEIFSGRAARCRPAGLLTTFSN